MSFTKLITMYAIFNATFRSFKALQRSQRFSKLIDEHNTANAQDTIDEDAVLRALDKKEIIPMLHFWTCFAFIQLFDTYLEDFVSWIPFYSIFKMVILLWIVAPQTRGATVFFESFLTPQIERRMAFFEETLFPLLRHIVLSIALKIERTVLGFGLQSVSSAEVSALDSTMDKLVRSVTREGYLRRREESIQALKDAVPEERHRVALLDEILKEYKWKPNDDSDWTELRISNERGGLRVRFDSEFEDQEEQDDFAENEEATVDNGL
jgi:hypothetical protein